MIDPAPLAPVHADALVRVIEGAPQVRRRHHFFMWTQGPMQLLLPHQLAVCGAYQRQHKAMLFEAFHSVVVPAPALSALTDRRSALMLAAGAEWIANRGRPLVFDVSRQSAASADGSGAATLLAAGYSRLLLHGVARPQRPNELESLFVLASPQRPATPQDLLHFEMVLPYLHSAYLRMQAVENEFAGGPAAARSPGPAALGAAVITEREKQVLRWVRDGRSNQQIGEALAISPLTVKNHVQKILRKLGAANRAQAVAKAMTMQLLAGTGIDDHDRPDHHDNANTDDSANTDPGPDR